MSIKVNLELKNMDEFNNLVNEARKKARELEETVHKLNTFEFDYEVVPASSDGN